MKREPPDTRLRTFQGRTFLPTATTHISSRLTFSTWATRCIVTISHLLRSLRRKWGGVCGLPIPSDSSNTGMYRFSELAYGPERMANCACELFVPKHEGIRHEPGQDYRHHNHSAAQH